MTDSIPTQAAEAIDVGRLHASTDTEVDEARAQLGITLPTPTFVSLAADAARILAEHANATMGEVQTRADVERVKWLLRCREVVPWLPDPIDESPAAIDGKNEPIREAQFIKWCVADLDHTDLRRQLVTAEREHRLSLAQIDHLKERLRTVRAQLVALAPDRGVE